MRLLSGRHIILIFLLSFLTLVISVPVYAESRVLKTDNVVVLFDETSESAAREVARLYPLVKSELAASIGWDINFRPNVMLTRDSSSLRKAAGSDLIVALAVPRKQLVVLDISRVYAQPFTLRTTLKHELCHLFLHHGIEPENLPRWLNEGVCQWMSDGIAEIVIGNDDKILRQALLSERFFSMNQLRRFPGEKSALLLAYAESKSYVEYIFREYGESGLFTILKYLNEGDTPEHAIKRSLAVDSDELERDWHLYLKRKYTAFSYIGQNLPIILFVFAALITVYGFLRMLKKKRAYRDEPEDFHETSDDEEKRNL
jgi:hypothetical protein